MAFIDLFIVKEEDKNKKSSTKKEDVHITKFPSSNSSEETFSSSKSGFPVMETSVNTAPPIPTMDVPLQCAPHMEKIMELYEKGFAGLNQPGVEFFEFFQAVVEAGADVPSAYPMALKMLSTMDRSMSKESLLVQSQFYVNEIQKVHTGYNSAGTQKKQEILAEKTTEEQTLRNDIELLKQQGEAIKLQISKKTTEVNGIEEKWKPKLQEVDCKIMANEAAKNRIVQTLEKVINGIKTNLK